MYPLASTAADSCSAVHGASNSTRAMPSGALAETERTPGTAVSARSTACSQPEQLMPSTETVARCIRPAPLPDSAMGRYAFFQLVKELAYWSRKEAGTTMVLSLMV